MSVNSRQNRATIREKSPIFTKRSALTKKQKPIPGELELQRWISQAEYELHVDPYRGIQLLLVSLERGESIDTDASVSASEGVGTTNNLAKERTNEAYETNVGPWRSNCAFDTTGAFVKANHLNTTALSVDEMTDPVEEIHGETKPFTLTPDTDDDDLHAADAQSESDIASVDLIRITCQTSCPSLIQWTSRAVVEQQRKTRYKKRKLVERVIPMVCGRQRRYTTDDLSLRCSCDYNPFCLGTLGGAMDDALEEWSRNADMDEETHAHEKDTKSQLEWESTESVVLNTNGSTAVRPDSTAVVVWDWSDPSFTWYKPDTKALLRTVRKSQWVSKLVIKQYLQKSLQSLTATLSLGDGVQRIQESHQSLIFHNPLTKSTDDECDLTLHLSLPPGIENLGATCYLNTQMQCLAQNRVFVQGIMSWQPLEGSTEDRMNSILTLFQKLLLRMKAGPKCSVDTLEFSNALGLDTHEQQDPNEFSRLLFERMHASFQCTTGSDLAELLPHLFQGSMMYETSCLTCKSMSRRTEEFMDLNLPIVHPKKAGQQTIAESLFAKGNTDVQYCLEEYCIEEKLDGDNMYFCSHCGCKRDAKRAMTFQKLPPVLNVQISRYVFDREKLIKKKLSNKVLLPLDLEITARSVERKEGSVAHRYVLCAVMRHKGTSAYSGHYVAEAMDWLTGQWFEFNDEKVLLLESGPSCSFDPSTFVAKNETKREAKMSTKNGKSAAMPEISGSQDAYNMYYVEESFLAQSALDCLRKEDDNIDAVSVESVTDIERIESYAHLTQLCIRDRREAELLERRRNVIRQQIIPAMRGFTLSNPLEVVWGDVTPFLQFMSCRELITSPPPCPALCSHKVRGLHPRVARRGKLLPKIVFDTYVATILAEQQCLKPNQTDFYVQESIPIEKVICRYCSLEYQCELSEKLIRVKALKLLYDELSPKESQFSLQLGLNGANNDADGEFAYVVSKKFVTWFRQKFAQVLKKASVAMNEANIGYTGSAIDVNLTQSVLEGLDGLDLHEFEASYVPETGSTEADEFCVNKQITCTHGRVNAISSKSVMYVPCRIWSTIKELFPCAIEHKRKRRNNFPESESDDDNFELGCQDCRDEGLIEDDVRKNVTNLVKHCNESLPINVLTLDSAFDQARVDINAKFRLLHWDDLGAWHKFVAAVRRKNDKKRNESLKAIVRATLFPSSLEDDFRPLLDLNGVAVSDTTRMRMDFLSSVFRPIMCRRHNLPIREALFEAREGTAPNVLNRNICCIDTDSYERFLVSLIAVSGLIYPPSNQVQTNGGMVVDASISEAVQTMQEFRLNELRHPLYTSIQIAAGTDGYDQFSVSSDTFSMLFQLDQQSCDDKICLDEYRLWQGNEANKRSTGTDDTAAVTRVRNIDTGVAHDPIAVDSDIEEVSNAKTVHYIRVFDVKVKAEPDSLMEALASCTDLPNEEPDESTFSIRRSSRKRKTRYPVGVVLEEESIRVDFRNNLASLRLLLLERCTKGTIFELDHSVKLLLQSERLGSNAPKTSERLKLVDLSFDLSSDSLCDICQRELGEKIEHMACPSDTIMLIRQSIEDGSVGSLPKDALMDHFIGLSNTATDTCSGSSQRSVRTRTEKGFAGTFLSSQAPEPVAPHAEKACDSDDDPEEKKMDVHSEAKSPPSNNENKSIPFLTGQSSLIVDGREEISKVASAGPNHFDLSKGCTDSNANGRKNMTRHDLKSSQRRRSSSSAITPVERTDAVVTRRSVRRNGSAGTVKIQVIVESSSEEEIDDVDLLKNPFLDLPRPRPRDTNRFRTLTGKESVRSNLPDADTNEETSSPHIRVNDDGNKDLSLTTLTASLLQSHPDLKELHHDMLWMVAERVVREHVAIKDPEKLAYLAYLIVLDFIAPVK